MNHNWKRAEDHLFEVIDAYESLIGMPNVRVDVTLEHVIYPLRERYAKGERTKALYDEIMELKL